MNLNFETKADRSKEANLVSHNSFDLQVKIKGLERMGYEVGPYKYKTDQNGNFTTPWLYRACLYAQRKTVWINFTA